MAETSTPIEATEVDDSTPDTGADETPDVDTQIEQFLTKDPDEEDENFQEPNAGEDKAVDKAELKGDEKEVKEPEKKEDEQRLYTVKVNGKEFDVDERELVRGYTLARASQEKFEQAATVRKQAETLVQKLKDDPLSILTHPALGIDFRKLAEDYLVEQFKMEQMDPQSRAMLDAQKRLAEMERERQNAVKQQEEQEMARQQEAVQQHIDQEFTKALSTARIPKTPGVVKRMAELSMRGLDAGIDYTAEELVDMVRQELLTEQQELLGRLSPDELEQFLGKKKMTEVRKADIAKSRSQPKPKAVFQQAPKSKPAGRYVSERDLREHLDERLGKR